MSESKESSQKKPSRRAVALVGLAIVFVIALLVNFVVDRFSLRADLTEYGVYTLSGARRTSFRASKRRSSFVTTSPTTPR